MLCRLLSLNMNVIPEGLFSVYESSLNELKGAVPQ